VVSNVPPNRAVPSWLFACIGSINFPGRGAHSCGAVAEFHRLPEHPDDCSYGSRGSSWSCRNNVKLMSMTPRLYPAPPREVKTALNKVLYDPLQIAHPQALNGPSDYSCPGGRFGFQTDRLTLWNHKKTLVDTVPRDCLGVAAPCSDSSVWAGGGKAPPAIQNPAAAACSLPFQSVFAKQLQPVRPRLGYLLFICFGRALASQV